MTKVNHHQVSSDKEVDIHCIAHRYRASDLFRVGIKKPGDDPISPGFLLSYPFFWFLGLHQRKIAAQIPHFFK